MQLSHYTLNTGHLRMSPRSEVADSVIRYLDPLVKNLGGYVPGSRQIDLGFSLSHHENYCVIQIWERKRGAKKPERPFVSAALAWSDDAADLVWENAHHILMDRCPSGARPYAIPLLLVILHKHAKFVEPDVLMATADLERSIAWTILSQEGITE